MPRSSFALVFVLVVASLVPACSGKSDKNTKATVTGTVAYLQRITLPPDAEVHVRLEDISLQDAPPGLIGEQTFTTKGKQVPVPFKVEYDPKVIEESHSYSVRAEISIGGQQKFVTTQSYPVLTRGNPANVDVIVMALQAETPVSSPLVETHWTLVELGGSAIAQTPTGREPHLLLIEEEHRAAATGGCNQMTGSYETSGSSLTFSKFAATQRACPDGMDRDQALAKALASTASFQIEGTQLALMDASGTVLARFQAATNEEE
jgi:putative lipoprotein